ncbi:hypothetical protein [Micromonospora chalcea]|uniref:hypothetical protein n=1 Tax=Micromonospora chalcea TaxID=1874 RepID=UPI00380CF1FE
MVAASILLIVVAVVLLVAGLAGGSSLLLIVSIAASVLSAVVFVAFARQAAAARATAGRATGPRTRTAHTVPSPDDPVSPVPHHTSTVGAGGSGWRQPPGSPVTEPDAPPSAAYSPPADPFDADPYTAPYEPAAAPYEPAGLYDRAAAEPVADAEPAPYSPPGPHVPETARPTSPAPGEAFDGDPPAEFLSAGQVARLVRLPGEVLVVDGHPRFHLPGCPHLVGREDEPVPVAEAVGLGFTPCAQCAAATTLLAEARPR